MDAENPTDPRPYAQHPQGWMWRTPQAQGFISRACKDGCVESNRLEDSHIAPAKMDVENQRPKAPSPVPTEMDVKNQRSKVLCLVPTKMDSIK